MADQIWPAVAAGFDTIVDILVQLEPHAQKVTLDFSPVNDALHAADLPLPFDTVRYLLAMFLCYPYGVLFSMLPAGSVKHVCDVVVGIVLAQFVFGSQWMVVVVAAGCVYMLMLAAGALGRSLPLTVFAFMLGFMTLSHLVRQYEDYMGWKLDITGPLMILTIKVSSIGYQYNDGVTEKAKVKDRAENGKGGEQRMYKERLSRALSAMPGVLEFWGFVFCPTTFFAGPALDLKEYQDATRRPAAQASGLPSRAFRVLQTGVFAIVFLGLTGYGQANYPLVVGTPPNTAVNPIITDAPSLLHTYGNAGLCLFFTRVKYYFAWLLAESTAVLAGFGFSPKHNNWTAAANVDVIGFEFAPNISMGSRAWNKHTQTWLERYVYKRAPRAWSMMLTYFVSAFWHGFYPGYYLFFLSVPLAQNVSKMITARVRPLAFVDNNGAMQPKWWKPVYDVVGIVATHFTMNYLASAFVVLGWGNGLAVWTAYRWMVHVGSVLLYPILAFGFRVPKKKTT